MVWVYFYLMNKSAEKITGKKVARSAVRRIHVNLPEEVHQKLRVKCALEDVTIQEFVERLISERVKDIKVSLENPMSVDK